MDFNKDDVSGFVGKSFIYIYDAGWRYELYVKNEVTIDYRVHSGIVAGRWVKDQAVNIVRIAKDVYRVSWSEPTGNNVALSLNLHNYIVHGTIFFPRWVINDPKKIACFQNEYLNEMEAYREAGPVYPIEVVDSFATLIYMRDCGINNEEVIACPPSELPDNYPECLSDKNLLPKKESALA
ncbi:phenolic acid decarboxylase [Marinomonas transparens]|uniref:Phenolic acid decarboxylase n=1 Tax=Marinomonas transparens TaxID=2795388 RepID=A0A934N2U3_9GAMM|nr:phenolic acid decarboxylase [Marinomonas transparens]MBJ7539047.1 phenolic acid decarboxylase [Marinomonas transparens]